MIGYHGRSHVLNIPERSRFVQKSTEGNVARQKESWLPGGQHRQEMAMETKQVRCSELEKHAKLSFTSKTKVLCKMERNHLKR